MLQSAGGWVCVTAGQHGGRRARYWQTDMDAFSTRHVGGWGGVSDQAVVALVSNRT